MLLQHVYFIVILYFLIGAISIFFINRKGKNISENKERWLKYVVYLAVVNIVIEAILHDNELRLVAIAILLLGLYEIVSAWLNVREGRVIQLISALVIYSIVAFGFWHYAILQSASNKLYVYLLVFVFDGFCQISGQLFGKHKLSPNVSPNKTIEGLLGGYIITIVTCVALSKDFGFSLAQVFILSTVLCIAALTGDLAASYYKRICKIKDYSKIIPGHGGVLDRFDSFIVAGAVFYFLNYFHLV